MLLNIGLAIAMSSSTVVLACLAAAACLVAIVLWFRLAAERRAFEAQRRAAAVLHRGDDAVLLLDGDGVITFANRAAGVMAGRERSALEGTPITDWILGEDAPMLAAQLGELRSAPPNATESIHGRLNHPTLGERNLEATARNLLQDDEVGAIVLTLRDVTAGWELEEQLGRRAFWDPLTELPNRALFFDRVAHSLSRPDRDDGRGMIVLIDIDDMRGINEGTDMNVGNRVLQAVADRIRVSVPEGDSVARVGGDTFAVLLDSPASEEDGVELAHRLLRLIRLPIGTQPTGTPPGVPSSGRRLSATACIGIAPLGSGGTVATVLADADVALHRAKQQGPGGVAVFKESLRDGAAQTLRLRSDLPRALLEGELHVEYQAIFPTVPAAGRPTPPNGFEGLIRWTHPELGPIPPAGFIPAAEAGGLIGELGGWVLTEACHRAARWRTADREFTISVNVSALQLAEAGFIDHVSTALDRSGLPARLLVLELTESVLIDSAEILGALTTLRELGVGLAIDDFGTGYSSLSYLQKFPVTRLKIDRSFVSRIEEPSGKGMVQSILQLAGDLGLSTVAEGVETESQLALLGAMGCDQVQGFLLARPVPADLIEQQLGDGGATGPDPTD